MGYESKQRPEIIKKPGIAIVLAAGRGSRMKSAVPKQYLPLNGRPVLAWSLAAFQESDRVGEILLVFGRIDIGVLAIVENAEESVETHIN